jgi:hypothetical protein
MKNDINLHIARKVMRARKPYEVPVQLFDYGAIEKELLMVEQAFRKPIKLGPVALGAMTFGFSQAYGEAIQRLHMSTAALMQSGRGSK